MKKFVTDRNICTQFVTSTIANATWEPHQQAEMKNSRPSPNAVKEYIEGVKEEIAQQVAPVDICARILTGEQPMPAFMEPLNVEERYYWLGNIFTSLIPRATKRELAAYFTPPLIAKYTITRAKQLGCELASSRIIDPASGGAAFLTPLSAALIEDLRAQGKADAEIGIHLLTHLSGVEIDNSLAKLSGIILNDYISLQLPTFKKDMSGVILNEDSLRVVGQDSQYDVVVSNPPYGKILNPDADILEKFADSLTDRQVNKYALFIRLSIDWAKKGGFIALVIPTSFFAGPSFANLRKSILEDADVLAIDLIDERDGLFVDVLQDACVLFLRKKDGKDPKSIPSCRYLNNDGTYQELGTIDVPSTPSDRAWVLPCESSPNLLTQGFFSDSFARLADYGYGARAGYFVWNRQKERCREGDSPDSNEYPLVWAHCVKPNQPCRLSTHRLHGQAHLMSLVRFDEPSQSLINSPAVILQRTTNRRQARRLIAGYIPQSMLDEFRSFISENHTIVVYPLPGVEQSLGYEAMCRLLNSKPVDNRYRQISGTVSISVKLLKDLPLPSPSLVREWLSGNIDTNEMDDFIEESYRRTAMTKK
ncbi:HsdM family class I SAM-dependent methyltransferase [Geomonas edaphica]|uniref:HsdM family class I SAM-dependent methyltransferase n=1 Tax=Geomonas edaphica TaxID=2570226 RepID=UPI0010A93962|nr:N-6 DNA methylase [Geomonas edaphica]